MEPIKTFEESYTTADGPWISDFLSGKVGFTFPIEYKTQLHSKIIRSFARQGKVMERTEKLKTLWEKINSVE